MSWILESDDEPNSGGHTEGQRETDCLRYALPTMGMDLKIEQE